MYSFIHLQFITASVTTMFTAIHPGSVVSPLCAIFIQNTLGIMFSFLLK